VVPLLVVTIVLHVVGVTAAELVSYLKEETLILIMEYVNAPPVLNLALVPLLAVTVQSKILVVMPVPVAMLVVLLEQRHIVGMVLAMAQRHVVPAVGTVVLVLHRVVIVFVMAVKHVQIVPMIVALVLVVIPVTVPAEV